MDIHGNAHTDVDADGNSHCIDNGDGYGISHRIAITVVHPY